MRKAATSSGQESSGLYSAGGGVGTSSAGTSSGTQGSNSTMDVNLNVKVDSTSPNIDTKQMESVLTNPAFMEKLTVAITEGMAKMNPVK